MYTNSSKKSYRVKFSFENQFIIKLLNSFLERGNWGMEEGLPWGLLDWNKMMAIGKHQNLLPLFHQVLSYQGLLEHLPVRVREELEEGFLDHTALTLLYDHTLRVILNSFRQKGVSCILLKGASIALEFYHPRESRPYTDLDLLVKKSDVDKAKKILMELGFRISNPEGEEIRRKYFNSVSFSKTEAHPIDLDLHWEAFIISWNKRPFLSSHQVWEKIRWIEFPGLRLPVLQPYMLILYLAFHFTLHHHFGKLLSLCDLDKVIEKWGEKIDWDELIRQAVAMKIKKPTYYSLRLAQYLLKTKVPERAFKGLAQNKLEERLFPFEYLIFREKPLPPNIDRLIKLLLVEGLQGKIRSLITFYRQLKAKKPNK
jgi:hypothetical protein